MPKQDWPKGPWHDEPDEFEDTILNYTVKAKRNMRMGHWCGYIEVPEGHPWWGLDDGRRGREEDKGEDTYCTADIHGGCTFGDNRYPWTEEDPLIWVIGFDCNHYGDMAPGMPPSLYGLGEYRTLEYVKLELHHLVNEARNAMEGIAT